MEPVLNTYNYRKWEKGCHDAALAQARELIRAYRNGIVFVTYTANHSKEVETYKLMKVWHLLDSNGIFLYDKVWKVKDKCRVRLELWDATDTPDSESDSEDAE